MYRKKECVAMLLAGGQGSRLYALTKTTAKPAVIFGGKYRIIDFPLSNCINSGIDTVGVLTQYQPLALNEYVGTGLPWDLDRNYGGVKILPPYQAEHSADWYKGTANAIYQNLNFIKRYEPEYVLILSGDHIYKMDYHGMLQFHKKSGADCTIATIDVPREEAFRFGILSTDRDGKIYKFEEKPKQTSSTKASMGIYIFSAEKLYSYLTSDAQSPGSENDFGKNIIPSMLSAGEKLFAYPFSGYWKDVGTLQSLWEANMDLLGDKPAFRIRDGEWRIYSRSPVSPPHYAGEGCLIENSIVTEGCEIYGTIVNSVISPDVTVEKGALVRDSVIMSGAVIKANAVVNYSILDTNVTVGEGAFVGADRNIARGITVLGSCYKAEQGVKIEDGSILSVKEVCI